MAEEKTVISLVAENDLYQWLKKKSAEDERSLNSYILRILRKLFEADK